MKGQIKSIDSIKNMAVFQDFNWSRSMRHDDNSVAEFKKINIIYGRNYSGKTTLSRIIRALETGTISTKYQFPEFNISFRETASASNTSLKSHGQSIRVFNEDFIKENLQFIIDDSQTINSFAILGEDNGKIEQDIAELEAKLGSDTDTTSLLGKMFEAEQVYSTAKENQTKKTDELEAKLKDKANKAGTGIKHNKTFGDANYNVNKLKADIETVLEENYSPITPEQAEEYHRLLREELKEEIPEYHSPSLNYSRIALSARELIERKISVSDPLQELLSDTVLENWVREGRTLHRNLKTTCGFCGNFLPQGLWEKLDKHFNQESEQLRAKIDTAIALIKTEKQNVPKLFHAKSSDFYSNFSKDIDSLNEIFLEASRNYIEALNSIEKQLCSRKDEIFTAATFIEPPSPEHGITLLFDSYETLRLESNKFANELGTQQKKSRTALRLNEVFTFITDIKYKDELKDTQSLTKEADNALTKKNETQADTKELQLKIVELKAQLKDESKGAEKVNEYLNNFFGHQNLSLKAIEETSPDIQNRYRFEVTRNNQKAFHLSEGECSLIAFCYFMAKLDDYETKGSQPIIWIDDPICSLDSNHIFFIYSLINSEIVTPEKYEEHGEKRERDKFKQIFISTHNLDFLKYLKRIPGAEKKKESQYFIVTRLDQSSDLKLMPNYLKEFVTEFNYLFSQIHHCATLEDINDKNYTTFYNFGNNARKFFEIYLYYKYPDKGMTEETLYLFFGKDSVPAVLTSRINNEYSHLAGVFERGATPVEVPEMKRAAALILKIIEENDPDQYRALLKSIGVAA